MRDAMFGGSALSDCARAFNKITKTHHDTKPGEGRDLELDRALPGTIAAAIIQAYENLEPATLRAAAAPFTLGTHRRLKRPHGLVQTAANLSGPADAEVVALGAYRPDGTAI